MKKIILITLSFIFTLSIMILCFSRNAYADPLTQSNSQSQSSINFMFNNNLKSVGVAREQQFSFYVQKDWKPEDSFLNLVFTQSQLTITDESTLTVQVNGISIYSMRLTGKNNYNEQLKVPIRASLLKTGDNEITIETHRRIGDDLCADDANSANWIEFSKDSFVHLNYTNIASKFDLNEFPYPFIDNTVLDNTINIVTPDKPTNDTIAAAMELSGYLGYYGGGTNTKIVFNTFKSTKDLSKENIIFLVNINNLPENISSLLTKNELETCKTEPLIKNIENPYNKNYNMLLIVGNDTGLIKAVKFLDNKTLLAEAVQSSIFLNDNVKEEDVQDKSTSNILSFKKLGYGNVTLKGPLLQTANYNLSIPPNKLVQAGATLNLKFRYAKSLDFNRALITAYINNVPIGSKALTEENADNDTVSFTIPKDIRENNNYNIRIEFNLDIKAKECAARDTKNPWAFISNESFLDLPSENRSYYSFSSYPYPFVSNNQFNNLLLVLPDNLNNNNLSITANIISYIGKYAKYNNGTIRVVKASEFNKSMYDNNIIILGTPTSNSVIKDVNDSLYLKFNSSFDGYQLNNPKIQLLPDYSKNVTTLQLIKSPFNNKKGIMVISSPKEEDLNLAGNILNNSKEIYKLTDNVALLDNNGNITNYSFDLPSKENIGNTNNFKINISIVIFIITLIIILIIITILFRKKMKKYN